MYLHGINTERGESEGSVPSWCKHKEGKVGGECTFMVYTQRGESRRGVYLHGINTVRGESRGVYLHGIYTKRGESEGSVPSWYKHSEGRVGGECTFMV